MASGVKWLAPPASLPAIRRTGRHSISKPTVWVRRRNISDPSLAHRPFTADFAALVQLARRRIGNDDLIRNFQLARRNGVLQEVLTDFATHFAQLPGHDQGYGHGAADHLATGNGAVPRRQCGMFARFAGVVRTGEYRR